MNVKRYTISGLRLLLTSGVSGLSKAEWGQVFFSSTNVRSKCIRS